MGWFTSTVKGIGSFLGLRQTKASIEEQRYKDEQRYYELNRNRQINEDTQSRVVNLRLDRFGLALSGSGPKF